MSSISQCYWKDAYPLFSKSGLQVISDETFQLMKIYPQNHRDISKTYQIIQSWPIKSTHAASTFQKSCYIHENGIVRRCSLLEKEMGTPILEMILNRRFIYEKFSTKSKPNLLWLQITLPNIQYADIPLSLFQELETFQYVNRIPQSETYLNRKDQFALSIQRMIDLHGEDVFGIHPKSYILPSDWMKLQQDAKNEQYWICKPVFGGQGKGIQILTSDTLSSVDRNGEYMVQKYIENPFLIMDRKFTIRVYVLITSILPLRIYLYEDCIVKFATERYIPTIDSFNSNHTFMHITNQALNKYRKEYRDPTNNNEKHSSRWNLEDFRIYLQSNHYDFYKLWKEIKQVIIKSILAVEGQLTKTMQELSPKGKTFQLLGTDIDIDSNFRPWIIESNVNPTITSSLLWERKSKAEMLSSMMDIVGLVPFDLKAFRESIKEIILKEWNHHLEDDTELGCMFNLTIDQLELLVDIEYERYFQNKFERIYPSKETMYLSRYLSESNKSLQGLVSKWMTIKAF